MLNLRYRLHFLVPHSQRPTTGFSFFSGDLGMGDCKTYFAMQCEVCCLDIRCAVPTDEKQTMPFVCNLLGFTFCYDCDFATECCLTIKELKQKDQDGEFTEALDTVAGDIPPLSSLRPAV